MDRATYANRLGFEALKDMNTPDFFDCDCGGMYEAGHHQICPRCGKRMCPDCMDESGNHRASMCYNPDNCRGYKPDIQDHGNGLGETQDGRLVRLNEQGVWF